MGITTPPTNPTARLLAVGGAAALFLAAAATAAPANSDMPLSGEEILKLVAISGGLLIAALAIIFGSTKSMVKAKEREQTKRELAAYVAEGSMRPEDAEKILKADQPVWEKDATWGKKD
ncbi:MAG: hypothetical protein AB7G17_09030 [Phycisphaerales bacterium]